MEIGEKKKEKSFIVYVPEDWTAAYRVTAASAAEAEDKLIEMLTKRLAPEPEFLERELNSVREEDAFAEEEE